MCHSRVAVVCGWGGTHGGGGRESWGRHKCQRFGGEGWPMMAAGGPARGAGQWPTPGWHIAADRPEWEVRVMPGDVTSEVSSGLLARGAGHGGDRRLAGGGRVHRGGGEVGYEMGVG